MGSNPQHTTKSPNPAAQGIAKKSASTPPARRGEITDLSPPKLRQAERLPFTSNSVEDLEVVKNILNKSRGYLANVAYKEKFFFLTAFFLLLNAELPVPVKVGRNDKGLADWWGSLEPRDRKNIKFLCPFITKVDDIYLLCRDVATTSSGSRLAAFVGEVLSNQSSSFQKAINAIMELPLVDKPLDKDYRKAEPPRLSKPKKQDYPALLKDYFDASNVPEDKRARLAAKFQIEIARAIRPAWLGRLERGGELATFSAPLFLKRVHAEDIAPDGTVENEAIRSIDPDLMKAVEQYLSKRRQRGLDAGDAAGLRFQLARPPHTRRRAKGQVPTVGG